MERRSQFRGRIYYWLALTALVLAQPSVAVDRGAAVLSADSLGESSADAAGKARDIATLLQLLDVWGTTASLGPVIADQFAGSLTEDNPELGESVSESFRQALLDVLGNDLHNSQSMLRQSYVDLYDRNFNAKEISELVAFYSTSTGQKYVQSQQLLVNDSAMVLQAWLNAARDRVILRFEELMAIRSADAQAVAN